MAISVINWKTSGISVQSLSYIHGPALPQFLSKSTEPPNGNLTRLFSPSGVRHFRRSSSALIGDRRWFLRRPQAPLRAGEIGVPRLNCRVPARRRRFRLRNGVRDGLGDQSANSSDYAVHQLRRAEEEQRSLLPPRRVLLQLPARSSGESLQPRLQRNYSLPELIWPDFFWSRFIVVFYRLVIRVFILNIHVDWVISSILMIENVIYICFWVFSPWFIFLFRGWFWLFPETFVLVCNR